MIFFAKIKLGGTFLYSERLLLTHLQLKTAKIKTLHRQKPSQRIFGKMLMNMETEKHGQKTDGKESTNARKLK